MYTSTTEALNFEAAAQNLHTKLFVSVGDKGRAWNKSEPLDEHVRQTIISLIKRKAPTLLKNDLPIQKHTLPYP